MIAMRDNSEQSPKRNAIVCLPIHLGEPKLNRYPSEYQLEAWTYLSNSSPLKQLILDTERKRFNMESVRRLRTGGKIEFFFTQNKIRKVKCQSVLNSINKNQNDIFRIEYTTVFKNNDKVLLCDTVRLSYIEQFFNPKPVENIRWQDQRIIKISEFCITETETSNYEVIYPSGNPLHIDKRNNIKNLGRNSLVPHVPLLIWKMVSKIYSATSDVTSKISSIDYKIFKPFFTDEMGEIYCNVDGDTNKYYLYGEDGRCISSILLIRN